MHYDNLINNNKSYEIQCNGENAGFYTTINEALIRTNFHFWNQIMRIIA